MDMKSATAGAAMLMTAMATAPQALAEEFRLCTTMQDGGSLSVTFLTAEDSTATVEELQTFLDTAVGAYSLEQFSNYNPDAAKVWQDYYKEFGFEEKGVEYFAKDPVFSNLSCE